MKVNGYMIRRTIKALEMKRESLKEQFNDSLSKFPGEEKEHPANIMEVLEDVEEKIALLQTIQTQYNNEVQAIVNGQAMLLTHAVKRVGMAGQRANLWKVAAKLTPDRNSYRPEVRRTEEIHLTRVMSPKEATNIAIEAEKRAQALRGAIAEANSKFIDIPGLEPELLAE